MSELADEAIRELGEAAIADEWGSLKSRLKRIEARIEALQEEFRRRNVKTMQGAKFSVTVNVSRFDGIDVQGARDALGAAWCKNHKRPVVRTTYAVDAVKAEKEAPAQTKPRGAKAAG